MHRRLRLLSVTLLLLLAAIALVSAAHAQPAGAPDSAQAAPASESFAGVFFISYNTDATGKKSVEVVGSMIIWLLTLLSVVNMSLIGHLALSNQRKAIIPDGVVAEAKRLLANGDYRQVISLTEKDQSFFSKVLHAGLMEANHGLAAIIRSLEQTADLLTTTRMRPVEHLYMLGQVSPMIGLFGTVYGIIYAFRAFVSVGAHASPAMLAGGIGTALVATFWGLVVAIPALAGYAMIRNKIDQLTMEAMVTAEELFGQFRTKPASTAAARPRAAAAAPAVNPEPAA